MSIEVDVPIVIVGGGGCGLTLSGFLSNYGIEHVLLEKHTSTSILPKAHYLNQRTMETLRSHNTTSLGGSGPTDRKVIHKFECFGGNEGTEFAESYKRDAPLRSGNLPLFRLEPILKRLAEEKNPGKVLFGHSMVDFVDEQSSVVVKTVDEAGKETINRCKYMIGADGGRTIGPKLGIEMEGPRNITDIVSVHFGEDLSEYWDDRYFACHFINGECGTVFESGAIVPMGPNWGKHSDEWVFHFGFAMDDDNRHNEEALIPRIRELLKIPSWEIKVHKFSHWAIERVLADSYRKGRVFLAGDAGNRRPPTTGLGLVPGQKDANRLRFQSLFEDSDKGYSFRAQVARVIDTQAIEFCAHGIELGFRYTDGFLVHDGSLPCERDPLGLKYYPTTQPGHRFPHAWVEKGDKILSTHDFVQDKPVFALITDGEGDAWATAAATISKRRGIGIFVAQIGDNCPYRDYDDRWKVLKGIQPGGAILVRPDNIVAWRSIYKTTGGGKELDEAVDHLFLTKESVNGVKT